MTHLKVMKIEKILRIAKENDFKHVSIDTDLLHKLLMEFEQCRSRMVKAEMKLVDLSPRGSKK